MQNEQQFHSKWIYQCDADSNIDELKSIIDAGIQFYLDYENDQFYDVFDNFQRNYIRPRSFTVYLYTTCAEQDTWLTLMYGEKITFVKTFSFYRGFRFD